jgi:hypothetical protein
LDDLQNMRQILEPSINRNCDGGHFFHTGQF